MAATGMNGNSPQRTGLWLTEHELARHLNISVRHLMNLRKAGLPHIHLGVSIRYDFLEVMAYLRDRRMIPSKHQSSTTDSGSTVTNPPIGKQ